MKIPKVKRSYNLDLATIEILELLSTLTEMDKTHIITTAIYHYAKLRLSEEEFSQHIQSIIEKHITP